MTAKILSFLFIALLFFFSCENDFEVTGEREEIMVINTILDPSQPVQYVKVTKAFLNKGSNALEIAKNEPDSIYYSDELEVSISQINTDGSILKSYMLTKTTLEGRDSGLFSLKGNNIYSMTTPVFSGDYKYQVTVKNIKTGKTAYAITPIIQSVCIRKPAKGPYSAETHCTNDGEVDSIMFHSKSDVYYYTAKNAALYEILIDFTYHEYFQGDFFATHKVRWNLLSPVHKDYNPNPATYQTFTIPKDSFFIFLESVIDYESDTNGIQRKVGPVTLTINSASADLEIYKQLIQTSKTLTQSTPDFTNVKGGLGLVASRNHRTIHFKKFSKLSLDSLILNYPELKFIK